MPRWKKTVRGGAIYSYSFMGCAPSYVYLQRILAGLANGWEPGGLFPDRLAALLERLEREAPEIPIEVITHGETISAAAYLQLGFRQGRQIGRLTPTSFTAVLAFWKKTYPQPKT